MPIAIQCPLEFLRCFSQVKSYLFFYGAGFIWFVGRHVRKRLVSFSLAMSPSLWRECLSVTRATDSGPKGVTGKSDPALSGPPLDSRPLGGTAQPTGPHPAAGFPRACPGGASAGQSSPDWWAQLPHAALRHKEARPLFHRHTSHSLAIALSVYIRNILLSIKVPVFNWTSVSFHCTFSRAKMKRTFDTLSYLKGPQVCICFNG